MITIEEARDWVLEHRKGKVFQNQTPDQIEWAIARAIHAGGFTFAQDADEQIVGICCASPNSVEKTLRVHHILAIDPTVLPSMIASFKKRFSGYTITAKRRGREIRYRTERLIKLLSR